MIDDVLDGIYEEFGIPSSNNSNDISVIRDVFTSDNQDLPLFRTKSLWLDKTKDENGIEQLVDSQIIIKGETHNIINWEYYGNMNEEIVFKIEGDYRV